ncbi:hypothetical protein [Pontibacter sp. G13]|uniref:hypothetical protein n=1 Tax=Pontibacter sp. G13 TaxID=3074898 RepID=UPI00288BD7C1|nr:hypothetical protein [Pontibacter sp. G13]WNJ17018.1 hypothetical protein RJD25_19360 [Pontibacter sp. G13]
MEFHTTQVPLWVSLSFGILFAIVPVWLIVRTIGKALERAHFPNPKAVQRKVIGFFGIYFTLVGIVALSGFLAVNVLPPRILIATAIPLFLFYLLVVPRLKWFQAVWAHVELEELIFLHVFRFVGVYFFLASAFGNLPSTFANIGGWGDVLTAMLVFPVLYLIRQRSRFARPATLLWNIFGMLDILSVITTAILVTRAAIATGADGIIEFATFPFCWIPAFAPSTIIFLHILIFRKLAASRVSTPQEA